MNRKTDPDWTRGILRGLQSKPGLPAKHVYEATVPPEEVAKRRAKNRMARKSRKQNRQ